MAKEKGVGVSDTIIVYEDEQIMVVNKPPGILVHEDGVHEEETIVDWFLARAPEARGVGEPGLSKSGQPLERSGVVHRLDTDTSGILVLAKTQDAYAYLKTQFHDRLVQKEYRAFVYGSMKEEWGTIDRPIGRNSKDFRLRSAQRGAKGMLREAITDWELITQNSQFAYIRLFPRTGRTHQIRVHLKAINHPVVKDTLYAPAQLVSGESLGFARLALHAHKLRMALPQGDERDFVAPLPPEFLAAEAALAV